MTPHQFLEALRAANEDDVLNALEDAFISLPITTPVEALELFNLMLDELTGERDAAHAGDQAKIDHLLRRIGL